MHTYDFEKALAYVEEIFLAHPAHRQQYKFRDRLLHTKRALMWADRLLEKEEADADIVRMSVIFHDVGYTVSKQEHAGYSAAICRKYLESIQAENDYIETVCHNILCHGQKERIHNPKTSMELILLIEADCLDESGVLSIIRDGICEGLEGGSDYTHVYHRLCERKIFSDHYEYHCVTKTGLAFIKEKQRLYKEIVKSLAFDLFES